MSEDITLQEGTDNDTSIKEMVRKKETDVGRWLDLH